MDDDAPVRRQPSAARHRNGRIGVNESEEGSQPASADGGQSAGGTGGDEASLCGQIRRDRQRHGPSPGTAEVDQGRGLIYQFGHDALKLESADASTIGIKLVKGFMRYHFDLLIPRERTIDVNLQRQATFAEVQRGFDPIRARFALAPAGEAYRIVSEIGAGSLRWE